MTLKDAQKKYADAVKATLTVTPKALINGNLFTKDGLISFCTRYFPDKSILYCSISNKTVTCITSKEAFVEESRQKSMIPGTKVRMTGHEGTFSENQKDWTVTHGPQLMCGSLVVWLDGYSGAYACDCLEIVKEEETV